ncbi:MAG: flavodoxin reductase (ferredoxin-NADPH reductase) family 1 [Ferruginibacter sp.]|nr:flavodoxin reductase (ferredoxin-NADPH reductase) family 1 [Ferruginibacter sp.]
MQDFTIKVVRIVKITNETPHAKTFVLEFLDESQPVYKPGQFLTLVFYTRHGEKRRSYSISSSPALNEPLSITIKKVENGEFSRMLLSHARAGDQLYTSGISGLFQLPGNLNNALQYFFIAAGSGITPCFSMLKTILATAQSKMVLIYSNRSEEETIFYNQLKKLQEIYPGRLTIRFLFSVIFDVEQSRLSSRLLQKFLDELLTVPAKDALFYVCGPFDYMRTVNITLLGRVPPQNIFKENFNALPRLIVPKPPDTMAHFVTIHINNQVHRLPVQYPSTILAVAKLHKIELPYSCEAGRCGSCIATCTSGKIWMAYNEVLTDDELERGRVLVCQSFPVEGDVEIVF